jgi:SnoaL-like domain
VPTLERKVDMRRMTVPLAFAAAAALATVALMSMVSSPVSFYAQARPASSYADDRAAIEDLQARYLFALDFHDPDLYVSTFTENGVLDYGSGDVKGRQAIKDVIARMPSPSPAAAGLRAAAARHNISNIVIKVDGNKAMSRSYWFHYSNDNPQRRGVFDGFGHYEDELVKVNGKWLFTKRKIYNEGRDEWAYKGGKNPAW